MCDTSYYKWKKLKENTRGYAPKPTQKRSGKRKINPEKLKAIVRETPDIFLRELAEIFQCATPSVFN